MSSTSSWAFRFDWAAVALLRLIGVSAGNSEVRVGGGVLDISFGPWRLRTPLANVAGATVTGPYRWFRAVGPRMSMVDRGITFGTNAGPGVCVCFHAPVPALLPISTLRHPAATLTVADPDSLARHLRT